MADLKKLTSSFWIVLTISTLGLSSYIPFLDNANKFYMEKFGFNEVSAGRMVMTTYLTATIASPFVGYLTD